MCFPLVFQLPNSSVQSCRKSLCPPPVLTVGPRSRSAIKNSFCSALEPCTAPSLQRFWGFHPIPEAESQTSCSTSIHNPKFPWAGNPVSTNDSTLEAESSFLETPCSLQELAASLRAAENPWKSSSITRPCQIQLGTREANTGIRVSMLVWKMSCVKSD